MKTVYLSDVNNPCVLKETEMWCIKMLFFTCTHAVIIINEHKPYSFQNHVGLKNSTVNFLLECAMLIYLHIK